MSLEPLFSPVSVLIGVFRSHFRKPSGNILNDFSTGYDGQHLHAPADSKRRYVFFKTIREKKIV